MKAIIFVLLFLGPAALTYVATMGRRPTHKKKRSNR